MGSYNKYYLTVDTDVVELENQIIKWIDDFELKDNGANDSITNYCWRKWGPTTKWHPSFMKEISEKFPSLIFKEKCSGEYNYIKYYLNGKTVYEPEFELGEFFPTIRAFNKTFTKSREKADLARKNYEKQQEEAKLASLKQQLKDLEDAKLKLQTELSLLKNEL